MTAAQEAHEASPTEGLLNRLMSQMEKINASDLHIKVGSAPIYRVKGTPQRIKGEPLSYADVDKAIREIMKPRQAAQFDETGSVDFAHSIAGVGRFRVNVFRQRNSPSLAARRVNTRIPSFEDLMLPKGVERMAHFHDGIQLVIGMTGSGKSTSLAAIINSINSNERCHILTIEDPIEYVYQDDKSFINQREVGLDVTSFAAAMKYAMREDPDVILVGEMRDEATVEAALASAETGHLVFGTLHATNCIQSITRMLEFFTVERQPGMRQLVALTLKSVLAQRLVPGCRPERPRVAVVELMFVNGPIRKHIMENKDVKIGQEIRTYAKDGMQDFNMALYRLIKEGWISEEVALESSSAPEQLQMQLKGMVLNQDVQSL